MNRHVVYLVMILRSVEPEELEALMRQLAALKQREGGCDETGESDRR